MNNLNIDEIKDIVLSILRNSDEDCLPDLIKNLAESLNGCDVYCPVENEKIIFYGNELQTLIPVFSSKKEFEKEFPDKTPEIFEFAHLRDFLNKNMAGIIFNPGENGFIVNKYLMKFVFGINRQKSSESEGYDVKVRLNDYRPLTWRDMIIPAGMTFMELDDALKTIWGFNGHHLSCFLIRKDNLIITDEDLSSETMMGCDYEANSTAVSEVFDRYNKVTYWYDFGDDWQFDIELKKKVEYDKDYITLKRFKGKYNPIEDCKGVYGLSEIVYCAEHPDEDDSDYWSDLVEYLEEFDMDFCQFELENKVYTRSNWHKDVYFGGEF